MMDAKDQRGSDEPGPLAGLFLEELWRNIGAMVEGSGLTVAELLWAWEQIAQRIIATAAAEESSGGPLQNSGPLENSGAERSNRALEITGGQAQASGPATAQYRGQGRSGGG